MNEVPIDELSILSNSLQVNKSQIKITEINITEKDEGYIALVILNNYVVMVYETYKPDEKSSLNLADPDLINTCNKGEIICRKLKRKCLNSLEVERFLFKKYGLKNNRDTLLSIKKHL